MHDLHIIVVTTESGPSPLVISSPLLVSLLLPLFNVVDMFSSFVVVASLALGLVDFSPSLVGTLSFSFGGADFCSSFVIIPPSLGGIDFCSSLDVALLSSIFFVALLCLFGLGGRPGPLMIA